jgi:hypothetical protein
MLLVDARGRPVGPSHCSTVGHKSAYLPVANTNEPPIDGNRNSFSGATRTPKAHTSITRFDCERVPYPRFTFLDEGATAAASTLDGGEFATMRL